MAKEHKNEELTKEEVEEQNAEELPDREVMSVINPGVDGIATIAPSPFHRRRPRRYEDEWSCGLAMAR